jgi:intracellular sulfur oxidation DsrE/DsrF family protein
VGAAKYEFLLTALTNLLTLYKRNGVAVLIHPNRASQLQAPNRTESIDYWYPILVY